MSGQSSERRRLRSHPQPETGGFVLVPREAPADSLTAGVDLALKVSLGGDYGWRDYMADLYRAMISASESPAGGGREAVARMIDPSAWEVFDGKWGPIPGGLEAERYAAWRSSSLAKADQIISLFGGQS